MSKHKRTIAAYFERTLWQTTKRGFVVFGLFAVLLPLFFLTRVNTHVPHAYAATSDNLNFQARLQTSAGSIAPDGYYNAEFKIYDATSGGTLLWTETYYDSNGVTAGNDNRVRVANGYLSVNLGSLTAFPADMPWDQQLYVTMNIGGSTQTATPTWDGEMDPRLKLTAVPYAFNAKTASQLVTTSGANIATLSILAPTSGNQTFQIQDQGAAGTYNILTAPSGSDGYIKLQGSTPGTQQTGNFNISGTGIASVLQAGTLDASSATALAIGTTNATAINLNQNTTIASGKSLTVTAGASSFTGLGSGTSTAVSVATGATSNVGITISAAASQTADLLQLRDSSGNVNSAFNAAGNQLTLGRIAGSGTVTQGTIVISDGTTSGFGATVQSSTLTADRKFLLPDTALATTASPGTICVFNGASSNCPAATGSTAYIWNSNTVQAASNFYTRSANTTYVGGVIEGANGQTADLLNLNTYNGTTSTTVAKFTAAGNLQVAGSLDTTTATTLTIGGTNATAINLNQSTVLAAGKSITISGGNTASRPGSPTEGMVYYDTTTHQLLTYNNSKWVSDRTDAVIVAASNSSQADKDAADYVADGNTGAANDGDQVQINAALTAAAGTKVVLLAGTYTADATILIPNNTTLTGVGVGTLIQLADIDATDNLIENSDTTTGTGIGIRDLKLDGQQSLQTGTITQYGVYLYHMGNQAAGRVGARISNVYVSDVRDAGIYFDASENNAVTNSTLYSIDAGGTAPVGIYNDSSSNNSFTNNTFLANYWGLRLDGSGTHNTTVTGNIFRGSTSKALLQFGATHSAITGNTFDSNTDALILYTSGDSTVSGNTFYANTGYSITLDDSSSNTITGNRIQNSGDTTDNNAIYVQNSSDSNTIADNTITDSSAATTNYAIRIASAGSDTNYLVNNTLGGGTIYDSGTGTIFAGQIDDSGYIQFKGMTGANIQGVTTINTTGTAATSIGNTTGNLVLQGGSTVSLASSNGTNSTTLGFTGSQTAGNIMYELDRTVAAGSYSICTSASGSCAGSYIQNQNASAQTTANFWISGSGQLDGGLTASGGTINLNASSNNTTNINTGTSTGAVNIGTGTGVKTITLGNAINNTAVDIQAGSGTGAITMGTGGNTNFTIDTVGRAIFQPSTVDNANFRILNHDGTVIYYNVDETNGQNRFNGTVCIIGGGVCTQGTSSILTVQGGTFIGASGSYTRLVTPATSYNLDARLVLDNLNYTANKAGIALGMLSTSDATARGIIIADARTTTDNNPTIGIYSPDENSSAGLGWDGSNTTFKVKTQSLAGATSGIKLTSGNITGGSGATTGAVTIQSGDGNGTNSSSGNVTIDSGTKSGGGTTGAVNVGTTNASAITLGYSGITTTNAGALTVGQLLTANLGATISGATINLNASSNFATNINTGTSTGTVTIGNSSNTNNTVNIAAGTTGGINLQAKTTVTGDLIVSNNTATISGTSTGSYKLSVGGTVNASNTGSQYGIQNEVSFTPTGASLSNIWGTSNVPTVAGSALNIGQVVGTQSGIATTAGYTGQIALASGIQVTAPAIAGSQKILDYRGVSISGNADNGSNTSGTITNAQIRIGGNTTAAGVGGTLNNYGTYMTLSSGSSSGTNNYGLFITGNGGGSANSNYAIYSNSTAASLLSGAFTTSGGIINLNTSSNFATNINTGTSTGTVTIGNASNVNNTVNIVAGSTGGINLTGTTNINTSGSAATSIGSATAGALTLQGNASSTLVANSGANSTTLGFTAPTGTRTQTYQDNSGVIALGTAANSLFFTTTGATNVTLPTSGTLTTNPATGSYIQQVPTSSAANTITPATTGVVGLTVNGTNTGSAATALAVSQPGAAEGVTIASANNTATNGLSFSGTFTNLISATNFSVTNAGAITGVGVNSGTGLIQGTGGATVTGTTLINATGTAATTIGNNSNTNNAVTIDAGNTGTIAIGNSASAHTVNIAAGGGANSQIVAIGSGVTGGANTSAVTIGSNNAAASTTLIQGGNGAGAISVQAAASGTITIGTVNGNNISLGTSSSTTTNAGTLTVGASAGTGAFVNNGTTLVTTTTQSTGANTSVSNIDAYSSFVLTATTTGITYTLPDPSPTTAGKIVYISNASTGSNSFTLAPTNGSSVLLNTGATATMLWNGTRWTYAGTDTSSLQNAYSNSQGGTTPEILLDSTRNGLDIQDANSTLGSSTPLLAVRASATASTLGSALFSVTNNAGAPLVGIGTNVATRALDVSVSSASTTALPVIVQNSNSTGDVGIEFKNSGTGGNFFVGQDSSNNNSFSISSGGSSASSPSSISFVQAPTPYANSGGSATIGPLAFGSNNTAGNAIVVVAAWDTSGGSSSTCSDTRGNIYTTVLTRLETTNNDYFMVCVATNIAAGANSVSVTLGTSGLSRYMSVHEYTGVKVATAVDTYTSNLGTTTTSADSMTSGAIAPSQNGDLIFGAFYETTALGQTLSSGTGFTQRTNNVASGYWILTEDKIQATASGIAATATATTGSRAYVGAVVALKATTSQGDAFSGSLFTLTQAGQATFKNFSDSSSAFQIQNAAATTAVFKADTFNSRVGINLASTESVGTGITLGFGGGADSTIAPNQNTSAGTGRQLTVAGGQGNAGVGGALLLQGGAGNGSNNNGGAVTILGGAAAGAGTVGVVNIQTTVNGNVSIGNAGNAANTVTVTAGATNGINLASDKIMVGNATTATTLQKTAQTTAAAAGAQLTIQGATGNTSGAGGIAKIIGGTGGTSGAGGDLQLYGGAAGGGATNGGNVTMQGGALSGAGSNGAVNINVSFNSATNIGTGSTTSAVSIGNSANTTNLASRTINHGTVGATNTLQGVAQTAANTTGDQLTIKGSAGLGSGNGGTLLLSGGDAGGTGVLGLVNLNPTAFTGTSQNCTVASCSITAATVNANSTALVNNTYAGSTVTLADPTITTAGRVLYVTNSGTQDMTLSVNGGGAGNTIALKMNTTATMFWNGVDWTAAGASSATDLQAAYNNTQSTAGGAEIVLTAAAGNSEGLTIRNNGTTPITGALFEVQSSIAANLFSVNNNTTEYSVNGGAENSTLTNWTGITATASKNLVLANVATGLASVQVAATGNNQGAKNTLSTTLAASTTYVVSFAAKASSAGPFNFNTYYSIDGTANSVNCNNTLPGTGYTLTNNFAVTNVWTKVSCFITTPASGMNASNAIRILETDMGTATFYIDNLSVISNVSTTTPANVQIGGGATGGQPTLFTLDQFAGPPMGSGNAAYYGSMYYDTTMGAIQCYQSTGWGACGNAPDDIVTLTPEYSNAVLNGTGVGTMTADFCGNGGGLSVNTGFCASGEARNYYKWTSPQPSAQTYSVYVTYKLPATFKKFVAGTTTLAGLVDDTTNAGVSYSIYRKASGGGLTSCSASKTVVGSGTGSANTWTNATPTTDPSTCTTFVAGDSIVFQITMSAQSAKAAYVENLNFQYSNK